MQELSTHGLMPEEWGGDLPMVQVNYLRYDLGTTFAALSTCVDCL